MKQDPLADALIALKNAESIGSFECTITPASKLIGNVLGVLHEENYIGSFEFIEDGKSGKFNVEMEGQINDCGAIKPRQPVRNGEFEKWEKRFLPARSFGALVLTTSNGVMTNYEAKDKGIGGQLLAYVY